MTPEEREKDRAYKRARHFKTYVSVKSVVAQGRDEINEKKRARYHSDPDYRFKMIARMATRNALVRGDLVKTPCADCGASDVEAHHEDYSKPLDVVFLCRQCHKKRHPCLIKKKDPLVAAEENRVRARNRIRKIWGKPVDAPLVKYPVSSNPNHPANKFIASP